MGSNVLISDALSPAAVQIFKDRGIAVDFQPKLGADKEKLANVIADFDGLAIRSATKVNSAVLAKAKIQALIVDAQATNVGAIESLAEARLCADFFRAHRDEIDG